MATELAGKYSNFLDPDLIKFGQKGSSAFSENSNQTGEDKLINLFRELRSPEAMKGVLQAKLDFDKEQMRAAYPYLLARELPGQIARAVNPLADPTTAAIVLNSYQQGLAGQRDIIRNIPQLQAAQFGMPSKNYFSSLG
jgi:hypothetical protein